jgi:ribosomal protein L20
MGLHRRRVWEIAKGFRGRARNCIKIARQQAEKALQHAYKGRKDKKKDTRSLWIQRVNAAAREHGVSGSVVQHCAGMLLWVCGCRCAITLLLRTVWAGKCRIMRLK